MRDENRRSVRVLLFLSYSRCYVTQHLMSGPLPASVRLRHLHGHCVVCYTIERWLVFVAVISAGSESLVSFWISDRTQQKSPVLA